jgi:hypothetical protein
VCTHPRLPAFPQIALQIGTKPKHWQWIAQFEIAAAMVVVGMLAALSLLWQYWGILSGREHYDDGSRQPLLDSEVQVRRNASHRPPATLPPLPELGCGLLPTHNLLAVTHKTRLP